MKQVRFIPIATCGLKVREGEGQEESRTVVGTPIVFGVRSVNLTRGAVTAKCTRSWSLAASATNCCVSRT
jgi:hypothetical protein